MMPLKVAQGFGDLRVLSHLVCRRCRHVVVDLQHARLSLPSSVKQDHGCQDQLSEILVQLCR